MKIISAMFMIAIVITWSVHQYQLEAAAPVKESGATISPSRFNDHMKALKDNGYMLEKYQ